MNAPSYRAYEEARRRANLAGAQLALQLALLVLVFPAACWLVLQGVEPRTAEVAEAPPRLRMGLVLMAGCGVMASGAWDALVRAARLSAEVERLRFQAEADDFFTPPPGGAAGLRGEGAAASAGVRDVGSRKAETLKAETLK